MRCGGSTFDYTPPPAGGQPGTQNFGISYLTTSQIGQTTTSTYTVGFTVSRGFGITKFLKLTFSDSRTMQWTQSNSTTHSTSTGQSASFSLTGPHAGYQGPVQVQAYQDKVFGTFMFAFTKVPTFSVGVTNSPQTVTAGGTASFNLTTQSAFGFTGDITFDSNVLGLPAGRRRRSPPIRWRSGTVRPSASRPSPRRRQARTR